jgi:hypothetical protein
MVMSGPERVFETVQNSERSWHMNVLNSNSRFNIICRIELRGELRLKSDSILKRFSTSVPLIGRGFQLEERGVGNEERQGLVSMKLSAPNDKVAASAPIRATREDAASSRCSSRVLHSK